MKNYKRGKGKPITDREAKIIGKRLDEIAKSLGGEFTAKDVVNDAKNPRSPLHKHFEWDDKIASEKWREHQARVLIGHVVEVVNVKGVQVEQRSFFNVTNKEGDKVYVTQKVVLETPDYAYQLIEEARNYIEHFSRVLQMLGEELRKRK